MKKICFMWLVFLLGTSVAAENEIKAEEPEINCSYSSDQVVYHDSATEIDNTIPGEAEDTVAMYLNETGDPVFSVQVSYRNSTTEIDNTIPGEVEDTVAMYLDEMSDLCKYSVLAGHRISYQDVYNGYSIQRGGNIKRRIMMGRSKLRIILESYRCLQPNYLIKIQ